MVCLKRRYEALEIGGRLGILIGDVRQGGKYTPIVKDMLNMPFSEIRSIIKKVQYNCTSDHRRYTKMEDVPIRHDYCIIFKKPANGAQSLPKYEQCLNWKMIQNGNRQRV